ncbi:MAG TPA: IS110 family transposase [Pseudomonadales bacterium]|nr:IS110 family transposase [Pseudomonadales bacterium]
MNAKTIAIDLAKNVYQLAISSTPGKVDSLKRLNRADFERFMRLHEPALVVMEACGSSHYWCRELAAMGHQVRQLPGQHVKGYRRGNKTDKNDAKALLEASRCEEIRAVPVKSLEQQSLQTLHRLREQYKATRVMRINLVKAIFREHGIEYEERTALFLKQAAEYAEAPSLRLLKRVIMETLQEITRLEESMADIERELRQFTENNSAIKVLTQIPGIGLLNSTALVAAVGDPNYFSSGRHLSAWLGITPSEKSSGESRKQYRITRRGDVYLRTLLIHGARSALVHAQGTAKNKPERMTKLQCWAVNLAKRIGHNRAVVAFANKIARIAWALWKHERQFNAELAAI